MRISDWSSDVCSSDLRPARDGPGSGTRHGTHRLRHGCGRRWFRRASARRPAAGSLTMVEKVRHQLFLPKPVSDRLEALAAKPGASKSAILTDAVTAWPNRSAASNLADPLGLRPHPPNTP